MSTGVWRRISSVTTERPWRPGLCITHPGTASAHPGRGHLLSAGFTSSRDARCFPASPPTRGISGPRPSAGTWSRGWEVQEARRCRLTLWLTRPLSGWSNSGESGSSWLLGNKKLSYPLPTPPLPQNKKQRSVGSRLVQDVAGG